MSIAAFRKGFYPANSEWGDTHFPIPRQCWAFHSFYADRFNEQKMSCYVLVFVEMKLNIMCYVFSYPASKQTFYLEIRQDSSSFHCEKCAGAGEQGFPLQPQDSRAQEGDLRKGNQILPPGRWLWKFWCKVSWRHYSKLVTLAALAAPYSAEMKRGQSRWWWQRGSSWLLQWQVLTGVCLSGFLPKPVSLALFIVWASLMGCL